MTVAELEKRVSRLEKLIDAKPSNPALGTAQWWLANAGAFADDPGYEQLVRFGRRYRQSLRLLPPKSVR